MKKGGPGCVMLGGGGGYSLRLGGYPYPRFLCTCTPSLNLKPLLDFSRAWWSVSVSPVLFTHVLPLNIECDRLKSW